MEQGPHEKKLLRMARDSGMPVPDVILNAPKLQPGNEYYYSIWYELQSDRPMGMVAGLIPSTAVRSWIKDHGIEVDSEEAEDIKYIIGHMDVAWLRWSQTKSEKEAHIRQHPKNSQRK